MAKRIKISIHKGVLIKADLPNDNPLSMLASTAMKSVEEAVSGPTAFSLHGRYASRVTALTETFHGAAPTFHGAAIAPTFHGAETAPTFHGGAVPNLNLFTFHGAVVLPIPEGQKVSSLEIRRGEDGELTIFVHE